MNKHFITSRMLVTALALLTIGACQKNGNDINPLPNPIPGTKVVEGNILKSTVARSAATVPEQDVAVVAQANNTFGWAMFNSLFKAASNIVFSPYSISTALSMTWVGTRGETNVEMKQALGFPFGGDRFHAAMDAIDRQLKIRGQGAGGREGAGFSLNVSNALWGEQTAKFSIYFLDTLARYYDAGMGLCDFVNNPDPSRIKINYWVSGRTNNHIRDILGPKSIDNETRLVLASTIYFDAAWADSFKHEETYPGWFYQSSGDSMKARFMNRVGSYNYSENEHFQALEMPYSGKQVSMIVLLPKNKDLIPSEGSVDTTITGLTAGFSPKSVGVSMPKFEFTFGTISLKPQLKGMGMRLAFTDQADFSGMCDSLFLMIKDVLHQAYIAVDEKGTTAAAATAVIITKVSAPVHDVRFNADHPFIFLIKDNPTGQAIFIGYVSEPTVAN